MIKAFGNFKRAKMCYNAPQRGYVLFWGALQMLRDQFWEHTFFPILASNYPFNLASRDLRWHCETCGWLAWAITRSKRSKNIEFGITRGLGSFLTEAIFPAPSGLRLVLTNFGTHILGLHLPWPVGPRYGAQACGWAVFGGMEIARSWWLRLD